MWGSDERGGINASLPNSYYCNALSLIPDLEDYSIIVVTDDVKNMESHYPILKDKMIVSEDEIVDFQILMNAQVVITANSSFSWWAAYLNTNVRKIFAPKCWLGFKVNKEIPWGVIPPEFVPVDTF